MIQPPDRDERVMALAAEALKTPPGRRDGFLQNACGNDVELYREVSEVVTWEERMGDFLSRPLVEFVDLGPWESAFAPGETISGRFEILRCVGEGGMGVVYEAFDRKRKQRIAIKCARPGFGRLLSPELESALKVRHRNVCAVNQIHSAPTQFGDVDFLTMEFLDGEVLSSRLAKGRLEEAEALEIARQICAGVIEAHRSGVLHRDLKPANIILCREKDGGLRAVITDFGISTESAATTDTEGGTPAYMAPELWRHEKASQASDVFSLGVILCEMVTGKRPFRETTAGQGPVYPAAPPTHLNQSLGRLWDKAVMPCLRAEPAKRCSAQQVLDALQPRPLYRRPAFIVALAACLALAIVAAPRIAEFLKPPPYKLALLPVEAPDGLKQRGQRVLDDVAFRLPGMQAGKPTVAVIPASKSANRGVATLEDAKKLLGATHALQLKLRSEGEGFTADATVIDLKTMAHKKEYSARFAAADFDDLAGGLAGVASWSLHLHRKLPLETVSASAATAYKSGREYLAVYPQDFAHAIPQFQDAVRLDPHSPLPAAGLAEAFTRNFQWRKDGDARKQARQWLDRAEALNADLPSVRRASGLLNQIEGNYPRALEDYRRVEELEPGNVEALLGAGYAYESQGMIDQAIGQYRQAVSLEPANYKPYEYLGGLHQYRGEYAEAAEWFRKDIERAPDRVNAFGSLAGAYIALAKYDEAEKVYKALLEKKKTALTLNNIGAMLSYQGKHKQALENYRQAIKMDPDRCIYWLNLGDSQRRTNGLAGARTSYRKALKLALKVITVNAADAPTRAYLAYLQARLGLKSDAAAQIEAAMNSPAKDDTVWLAAVQTYEVLGERDRALDAAQRARLQTRNMMNHHPDLGNLQKDSRFQRLLAASNQ
jgi:tetratricopeptide (TPR) repeat protein